MSHNLLQNTTFHTLLITIDNDLRKEVQKKGCSCGGVLHIADYPRSPLGLTPNDRQYYAKRNSVCCGTCRKRTKVPSVRFMGRRRYFAPAFMLISLLKCKPTERILALVQRHLGIAISRRTWRRWVQWWNEEFKTTKFFKKVQGELPGFCEPFPRALRKVYSGHSIDKLVSILKYLSPMTAGIYQAV